MRGQFDCFDLVLSDFGMHYAHTLLCEFLLMITYGSGKHRISKLSQ